MTLTILFYSMLNSNYAVFPRVFVCVNCEPLLQCMSNVYRLNELIFMKWFSVLW